MLLSAADIVEQLTSLLGPNSVISDPARMASYLREPRKRFHQGAVCVVLPRNVSQVQEIARFADRHAVPLIPQGGNTGLVGGQVPLDGSEVIVSLTRLDKIRHIDANAGVMTVEAGVTLQGTQQAAEAAGAMFPLWIASQGSARIGGILSSNAGGVQVLAYGNARELCLGVEAVLADGRLYRGLSELRKDNTGYDLKDLLVGGEGTLGIITAATLKLFPLPASHETALVNIASPEAALRLLYAIRARSAGRLTAFEIVPQFGLDMQLRHGMLDRDPTAGPSPWYALLELAQSEGQPTGMLQQALEAAFEAGLVTDATVATSLEERTRFWSFREQMSDVQSREGASIKHDVSVPVAAVPELIARGSEATLARVPGIRPCPFGHLGDGNIHFNFSEPIGADPKTFMAGAEAVHEVIYDIVLQLNGSVSAEHGIGQLKPALLNRVKDPVALEMMRAIKQALDPKGIMNPGKVLSR